MSAREPVTPGMKNSKAKRNSTTQAPPGMQVQLARLFGTDSSEAKMKARSSAQWKKTLRGILNELSLYLEANVQTDDVHLTMLYSGLASAYESLKDKDFWPGYAEGITRLALILMGDYPDHRKRTRGRKQEGHYRLFQCRSVQYAQTPSQKLNTLVAAPMLGIKLSKDALDALREFRRVAGYRVGYKDFFRWYREKYPQDYAAVF
jgi:hypothetical protein